MENYFLVSFPGAMFHGGIASDGSKVADVMPLFQHATRASLLPGAMAFAFQVPLFRLGGRSGSAVEVNFSGEDLGLVSRAAGASYLALLQQHHFSPFLVQPNPPNFDLPTPELQVLPKMDRLGEVGMTPAQLGLAVRALGDGAFLGDYLVGSQTVDLKLVADTSFEDAPLSVLGEQPIAAAGGVVPLSALADLRRVNAPGQINRTGRQRSVSLQVSSPPGVPLGEVIGSIEQMLADGRANGTIPYDVQTSFSGSASKLDAVKSAMLGDGSFTGTIASSLVLALLVVYLLMCVLFQSFLRPLIILFSVPLATLGGFAALYAVHVWSLGDRYMPTQNMDVLTMLGFVILIGIVVNNAILIVHQSIQFLKGTGDEGPLGEPMAPRDAIAEAVRSRVRPIFMSTMTSVLGMAPLVLMPGAGSELYRGLGSVVVGGLLVSTIFTLLLVPMLLSLVFDVQERLGLLPEHRADRSDEVSASPRQAGAGLGRLGTTLALLVGVAPFLGGCAGASDRTPRRAPLEEIAARLVRDELGAPTPAPAASAADDLRAAARDVEAIVGGDAERLAKLDALGGPGSYRDVAIDAGETRPIALADCIALALERDLALERARLQTDIAAAEIEAQQGVFDSVVTAGLESEQSRTPNRVPVLGGIPLGTALSRQSRTTGDLGVSRLLPFGSTVSLATYLELIDNKTDGIAFAPDPAWRSVVTLGVSHPLARGNGARLTEAGVALAELGARSSDAAFAADRLVVVATAELAFWDLAEAWDALRIRRRLVEQGEEVERVLRARQRFDVAPAAYSDALATLQARRTRAVEAERVLRFASDALRLAIGDDDLVSDRGGLLAPRNAGDGDGAAGTPLDAAAIAAVLAAQDGVELAGAVAAALDARPELSVALLAIEDAGLREELAADLKRPLVNLNASVGLTGLDDGAWDTYDSLAHDDHVTALVGISFENPVGRRTARATERQAQMRISQALASYEETLRAVLIEVKTAVRDVRTTRTLLANARATRIAATENVRTILLEEEARERLTPEFLALKLSRQDRLGEAQLAEMRALAAHRRAQAAYARAVGAGAR
jgi:outer membrane protein TolC